MDNEYDTDTLTNNGIQMEESDSYVMNEAFIKTDDDNVFVENNHPVPSPHKSHSYNTDTFEDAPIFNGHFHKINMFVAIVVFFLLAGIALNWTTLYLVRFKQDGNYEQQKQYCLITSIIDTVFLVILIFGLFAVWRYDRWHYISNADRVTYFVWLLMTCLVFATVGLNFWTYSNLNDERPEEKLDNIKLTTLIASILFTTGFAVAMGVYAVRGFHAQQEQGLFMRSIREMKEVRAMTAGIKYKV